jgi:hypothetical protein
MKKELEEDAKKYIKLPLDRDVDEEERYYNPNIKSYDAFIAGALYQQEQDKKMYSEEEVEKMVRAAYTFGEKEYKHFGAFKEWFEQFNNK